MPSLTDSPVRVSLDDAEATRDELEALREVLRCDEPFPDEAPTLDDIEPIDRLWWYSLDLDGPEESALDRWLETACPDPDPTPSGMWADVNGQFGYERGL